MLSNNHKNIAKFKQALRDSKGNLYIIMEFCDGGDLYQWRLDNLGQDGVLDENLMIEILRQIAKGLNYLHGKELGHRDLDPSNILVKNGQVKIVDFGFSFQ